MRTLDLFLREHAFVHTEAVARAETFNMDYLLQGVTDAQFRIRPHGLNSLAWLFWHMSRVEDDFVSCIVMARRPLFDEEHWSERLPVPKRNPGTGMSKDEVSELSDRVDLPALWKYRDAVGRRTRVMAEGLWPDKWEAPIEVVDLRRAAETGVLSRETAAQMEQYLPGKSRESALFWWGLNHTLMHLGQVTMLHGVVRTLGV